MTTTVQFSDDDFDEVERGIDWLERLEGIKSRRDKEAALLETVEYVDALRAALLALCADDAADDIAAQHGRQVADLVNGIRDADTKDPWDEYLKPALTES